MVADRIVMAACKLHGLFFGGGSRSTKPCVFPCKVAAADDERYLACAAVAAGVVPTRSVPPLCSAMSGCVCVRSSMRFLNLWLQIALEWLHDCCHLVLPFERSSIVFCNSVSADRIVVAASRLLGAAAACVYYSLLQLDLVNSIGVDASRLRQ